MSARLSLALESGGLVLPAEGPITVFHPRTDLDLSGLPQDRVRVIQPFKPDHDHFQRLGYACAPTGASPCAVAFVCLPRAKALARSLVAQASAVASGLVVVDGTKTDGIDSMLKACRSRVDVHGALSKAHGKIFWFTPAADVFSDWRAVAQQPADGFTTGPGVFSADGIDPASRLLADTLPARLGKSVVDLGAGWGYLTARILQDDSVLTLDLVEADHTALDCARLNVTDPRARFHWADATEWASRDPVDVVVTNPPFHTGRAADPSLGRGFIQAAARLLSASGELWLVANRHLPYEVTLTECFARVDEIAGDARFKVLRASRPTRSRHSPKRIRR
ncbi:class I SAM-dependent methyltransferase [Rhodobacteraceae bacterium F11138]|nr:class I SAM-dependent methyltransferase [Rhodobacteraceae bacterium F11138]